MKYSQREVAHRKTSLDHSRSQTVGQRYVSQELKAFSDILDDGAPRRNNIDILDSSNALTAAVQTELRRIRNHKLTGEALFARLKGIYEQHRLSHMQEHAPVIDRSACHGSFAANSWHRK